jgi:hypothetical protein
MSWSKKIKGSFADVRNALQTIAAEVQADDVKGKASDAVRQAHHLQAVVAVSAAEKITANIPFQAPDPETHEDRELELTLAGHGNEDSSGNVSVAYKIGPLKEKKATGAK